MVEDNVDMKAKIEEVLEHTGNTENRAAKMSVDHLLKSVGDLVIAPTEELTFLLDFYQLSMISVSILHDTFQVFFSFC